MADLHPEAGAPGRSCPLRYRYAPAAFRCVDPVPVRTAYVVGGLYGNPEALRQVLAMKRHEEAATGEAVTLVFNGDFNWFDVEAADFAAINGEVLEHVAMQGNVEAELDGDEGGCGCNYPEYVGQDVVDRSNAIMRRLQATARAFPELVARLTSLPMQLVLDVAGRRVAVVHGDATSLSGWGFAFEAVTNSESGPQLQEWFRDSGVAAFCSTHTGLPVLHRLRVDGSERVLINNGAAGMPNFRGTRYGLVTRVSGRRFPGTSLYGARVDGLHFEALAVAYDHTAWFDRFSRSWPAGSPASESYARRLLDGPEFSLAQADRSTALA